jgi:hypothetical protein
VPPLCIGMAEIGTVPDNQAPRSLDSLPSAGYSLVLAGALIPITTNRRTADLAGALTSTARLVT